MTLGDRVGNRWIVEKGLKPGDRVIIDAAALRDGTPVSAHPAPAAENQ